jgi:hypothetical protein
MTGACILFALVYVAFDAVRRHGVNGGVNYDIGCYLAAARGDFGWMPESKHPSSLLGFAGWCYPRWLAVVWSPFLWVRHPYRLWFIIQMFAYALVLAKLSEVPYGVLLVLASVKPFSYVIRSGNVAVVLSALCLSPVGAAIACIFKPYLLPVVAVHLFRGEVAAWLAAIAQ